MSSPIVVYFIEGNINQNKRDLRARKILHFDRHGRRQVTYLTIDAHVRPRTGTRSDRKQRVGSCDFLEVSDVVHLVAVHRGQQKGRAADVDYRLVAIQSYIYYIRI